MTGKYVHAVDPKGRLFVPSKLKEELGDTFYVTVGIGGCLSVYPMEKWTSIEENYKRLPISKTVRLRSLFALAVKCEPDKQGRFLLPAELREYAGLKENVTFIGQVDHAEIWNSDIYAGMEADFMTTPANLAAALEELASDGI